MVLTGWFAGSLGVGSNAFGDLDRVAGRSGHDLVAVRGL
jgi:hypothetical protein